ncbi:804_t:CDS:2 [Diversispora eburnea]|uniref:Vacuolar protein sorting-associated protein 28 n=1 Tax=Diversispora eburnea TaxID=1213867 RepID=A0A9N8YW27_9GLOM|nr:804_t:CDS:2 [Diversispora eburnea]
MSTKHNHALDEELKLYTNNKEREKYENLADVYAIIVTMEHLEKAYVRDSVNAAELTQYKTAMNLVNDLIPDVEKFMKEYKLECPAAVNRFKIGVPATKEHSIDNDPSTSAKHVAETVSVSVDEIHPMLSDLMQSLNNVNTLPAEFEAKMRNWLITLNAMKASDEIDESQVRQLLFDLENAHNAFYRSLSDKN